MLNRQYKNNQGKHVIDFQKAKVKFMLNNYQNNWHWVWQKNFKDD